MKNYDVVIIGAGQAGMFAANELIDSGLSVLLIDEGADVFERKNIMSGVGGAGTWSDGTLNLRPDIGGDLEELTNSKDEAWALVDYVDKIFLKHGAPTKLYKAKGKDAEELRRRAASAGIEFIEIIQRHIGTDNAPKVIDRFKKDLEKRGAEFLLNTYVSDLIVEDGICKGVVVEVGNSAETRKKDFEERMNGNGNGNGNSNGKKKKKYKSKEIRSKYVIACPGRVGGPWLNDIVEKYGLKSEFGPIDVGVRVEVPAVIMEPVCKINRDPKFHIRTKKYDDFTRTFCTNHHGYVVKETYDGFIGVNGHSMTKQKSKNTNFAFLTRIRLTEPVENTTKYGRSIAKLATTIGGGNPIVQRMGDLTSGRRSTDKRIKRNPVVSTLKDATPGDISMALPHRLVMNVIEGLEKLNEVIPGVTNDSTLLYAPEIKFYAVRLNVDSNMQTSIKNLFAAGDGAGLSRDIVNAAATGVLAGRGVLKLMKQP